MPDLPPKPPSDRAALPSDTFSPYAGPGWRKRLLIATLAVVTAIGIVWLMLDPVGGTPRKRLPTPDVAACQNGQSSDCVGSKTQVLMLPPAAAASR